MLACLRTPGFAFVIAATVAGCFSYGDVGYSGTEYKGCSLATPKSVVAQLGSRYALGSTTTLYLRDLANARVSSDDSQVVHVGPVERAPDEDGVSSEWQVELAFVGAGTAVISVAGSEQDPDAVVSVDVAPVERFEVVLTTDVHRDPVLPLAGRAVIDPSFEVIYFDHDGRLHGRGLAQSLWQATGSGTADAFFNDALASGPQRVEVRAADRASVIPFLAVAPEEVVALELFETQIDEDLIRVHLVGLTESGVQVWNIRPAFALTDTGFYMGSFDYIRDPDARPTELRADAWSSSLRPGLAAVETSIRGTPTRESDNIFACAAVGGRAPVAALLSLLLTVAAVRISRRR